MNRRAVSMIEMMVVITIIPTFLLISTQVYRAIFLTTDSSHRQLSAASAFDSAQAQFWRNLFNATEITSLTPDTIFITPRTGPAIRWQSQTPNLLRTAADQRTYPAPRDLRLHLLLQNQTLTLQLFNTKGLQDQAFFTPPFLSRSSSPQAHGPAVGSPHLQSTSPYSSSPGTPGEGRGEG